VKNKIPAVVHVDGTSRIQTVRREDNPRFHQLLVEFEKQTGIPLVVNTSFNRQGEPIVETPEDALRAFLNMPLDALAIEGYWVTRRFADNSADQRQLVLGCRMTAERAFEIVEHRAPGGVQRLSVQLPAGLDERSMPVGISRACADLLASLDSDVIVAGALRKNGVESGSPATLQAVDTIAELHRLGWIRLVRTGGLAMEGER
jgi:hypothetical protein